MWNPDDPLERQKRYAWSVAVECSQKTKEDALDIYKRLLKQFKEINGLNAS